MKLCGIVAMVLFSAVMVGCAWRPTAYYTLVTPMPSATAVADAAKTADFAFNVLPVGVPSALSSANLVVRQGDANALVSTSQHWTMPFADEVHAAVSLQLASELHAQDISGLQTSRWNRVVDVKLEVRRFDSWQGRAVEVNAAWSASMPKQDKLPILVCSETIQQSAAGGLADLVVAQQAAVRQLTYRMGQEILHWVSTGRNDCLSGPAAATAASVPSNQAVPAPSIFKRWGWVR